MRNFAIVNSALLLLCCALAGLAADITGDWKGDLVTPQGTVQVSYTFKQDGNKLTGTWQAARTPTVQITEAKIEGDTVSFIAKVAPEMVFAHEGTVRNGDEIEFTMKPSGEFPGATVIAKRVKR